MTDYVYQHDDDFDAFDAGFTSRIGDGSGDTEEVLRTAILSAATCKAGGRFLDIGSGFGRIVGMLEPFAGHLIGVEPDRARFSYCRDQFDRYRHVEIRNGTASDLKRGPRHRFDLIVVSMVLQHVSTTTCQRILEGVRALLGPGGVALIATTHFVDERFTRAQDATAIDAAQFDAYADRSDQHHSGLPVRLFDREAFWRALAAAGLTRQIWQPFYYTRPGMLKALSAMYAVPEEAIENVGYSQYALVTAGDPIARSPVRRLARALRRQSFRLT